MSLHYRPRFGVPTACGLGFLAHATDDWSRVTCPACADLHETFPELVL